MNPKKRFHYNRTKLAFSLGRGFNQVCRAGRQLTCFNEVKDAVFYRLNS